MGIDRKFTRLELAEITKEELSDRGVKCECGGSLQVVQEVSGSFVYDIDGKGRFDWDNREFYGDMDEYISCSKCEKVIDTLAHFVLYYSPYTSIITRVNTVERGETTKELICS